MMTRTTPRRDESSEMQRMVTRSRTNTPLKEMSSAQKLKDEAGDVRTPLKPMTNLRSQTFAAAQKVKRRSLGLKRPPPPVSITPSVAKRARPSPATDSKSRPTAVARGHESVGRHAVVGRSMVSSARTQLVREKKPTDREVIASLKKLIDEHEKHDKDQAAQLSLLYDENVRLKASEASLSKELSVCEGEIFNMRKIAADLQSQINKLEASRESLLITLLDRENQVRQLHNSVVDLRGQIRVVTRTRAFLPGEVASSPHLVYVDKRTIKMEGSEKGSLVTRVENVFGPNSSQMQVFEAVEDLIKSTVHGYNVTIVAYGQTGSGKTYTMRGGSGNAAGIIPRTVSALLCQAKSLAVLEFKVELRGSFLEIYNEDVYDLLSPNRSKLSVNMGNGVVKVVGLETVCIASEDDLHSILLRADKARTTASTKCNAESSRSHAIFTLYVKTENTRTGDTTESVLNLADLAGSERAKESGSDESKERFDEMRAINHALSTMQMCIRAQHSKQQHVPYRNSKLTSLLSNSLGGGNSKTLVIVALNPSANPAQLAETKRSLEFAQQLSKTHLGVAIKNTL